MATVTGASGYGIDTGSAIKQGIAGGIVAGLVFAMFEMVAAAALMGADAFFMPLRMIGAIALGPAALDPGYSLVTAAVVGVVVHMMLSAVFGGLFGAALSVVPGLTGSTGTLLAVASVFGLLLWVVNFYVLAPAFGWTWFPDKTNPVVQFFAHTFFFGTALGIYLDRALAGHRAR